MDKAASGIPLHAVLFQLPAFSFLRHHRLKQDSLFSCRILLFFAQLELSRSCLFIRFAATIVVVVATKVNFEWREVSLDDTWITIAQYKFIKAGALCSGGFIDIVGDDKK